jgi:hypothetical protein
MGMARAIRDQARGFGNSRLIVALEVVAHRNMAPHERKGCPAWIEPDAAQDCVTPFDGSAGEYLQPTFVVVRQCTVRIDRQRPFDVVKACRIVRIIA